MEQVPLTRNGHTDFGTVQWETQGRSLMVTVWCPLLLDDIYRAYWQDQTGEKHLLFVLEPKNERLFGQKKWTVNPFSLPPKSAWIQGKHEPEFTENPENAAEPAPERAKESVATQQLEPWVQADPLLCEAAGREGILHAPGALGCPFSKDRPVELLFAAAAGRLQDEQGESQLWIFPRP